MAANVVKKPALAAAWVGWAIATAVVSSMTPCAVASFRAPRTLSTSAMRSPYSVFLAPSSSAPEAAETRSPPAPTAPANANCEAPVNASRLSTHACGTVSPAVTAAAPKATPDSPTARPTPRPSRIAAERSVVCSMKDEGMCRLRQVLVRSCGALIGGGRDPDHPLEVTAQVRLVGEAHLGGHLRGPHARPQQPPRLPDPHRVQVRVRRQPGRRLERPQQRERPRVHHPGQLLQ